jgi:hypothetical protein
MEQILAGLIIGVVVAVSGGFVSHLLIRSRERERWDSEDDRRREEREHEDRRQREAREHEWQLKHRDDRLELYRRFLAALSEIKPSPDTPNWEVWEVAQYAGRETELIGSGTVRETARTLFVAQINQADLRGRVMAGKLSEDDPGVKKEMDRRDQHLSEANRQFIDAARKDLGMDPLTVGEPRL